MKKLLAILVVFTMVVGAVFAVDLGGTVIGTVNLLQSGDDIGGSANMNRVRIEGSGSANDNFGGWVRFDPTGGNFLGGVAAGLAWWKPIDAFKLTIGGNPDGMFGKDGSEGWGFQQMVSDTGVAYNGGKVWGWGFQGTPWILTRQAFYPGFGDPGLIMEINPIDVFGVTLMLPYFDGGALADIFKGINAQINLNMDFGNIAITYRGTKCTGVEVPQNGAGSIFAYLGLSAIENIGIDLGVKFAIPEDSYMEPIGIGVGTKIGISDAFSLKARVITTLAGDNEEFNLLFDILPAFAISDNVKVLLDFGLLMNMAGDNTNIGFTINPYLEIGAEWFPTFFVGFKFDKMGDGDANWSLPIAIGVSF